MIACVYRVISMVVNFSLHIFCLKLHFNLSVRLIPPLVEEFFELANILKFKTVVFNTYFELRFSLS